MERSEASAIYRRSCLSCGKQFATDKAYRRMCPECLKISYDSRLTEHQCLRCSATFVGSHRSKYCESCRRIISNEISLECHKSGPKRPIGSITNCTDCGAEIIVKGALQKRCPECARKLNAMPRGNGSHRRVDGYQLEYQRARSAESGKRRKPKTIPSKDSVPEKPRRPAGRQIRLEIFGDLVSVYLSDHCVADHVLVDTAEAMLLSAVLQVQERDRKSGISGICWLAAKSKWQVQLRGKYIGLFADLDDAKRALVRYIFNTAKEEDK